MASAVPPFFLQSSDCPPEEARRYNSPLECPVHSYYNNDHGKDIRQQAAHRHAIPLRAMLDRNLGKSIGCAKACRAKQSKFPGWYPKPVR